MVPCTCQRAAAQGEATVTASAFCPRLPLPLRPPLAPLCRAADWCSFAGLAQHAQQGCYASLDEFQADAAATAGKIVAASTQAAQQQLRRRGSSERPPRWAAGQSLMPPACPPACACLVLRAAKASARLLVTYSAGCCRNFGMPCTTPTPTPLSPTPLLQAQHGGGRSLCCAGRDRRAVPSAAPAAAA